MKALLSPDVRFFTPVTYLPYVGIEAVAGVLFGIMNTFTQFAYTDELSDGSSTALMFDASVGDVSLQGVDFLRDGADGKIVEFIDMMRPMSAVRVVGEEMARRVNDIPRG